LVVWGTIERVYASHHLLIRSDDDWLYTVRASGAPIELSGGDLGQWSDLRTGQWIDVYGTADNDQMVDATYIRITGGRPTDRPYRSNREERPYPRTPDENRSSDERYLRSPDTVEILGTVSSVDRERESFRLQSRHGLRNVELFVDTVLRFDSGERADQQDIREGDEVAVSGRERGGRFVADRVRLMGATDAPKPEEYQDNRNDSRTEAVLTGTVRGETYYPSRQITVRSAEGNVKVDVERDTPIYELGERISVHDLESGDHIRVVGVWNGRDRFVARRIEITRPGSGSGRTSGSRSATVSASSRFPTRTIRVDPGSEGDRDGWETFGSI
jgi:hypothetical protein